MVSLMEEYNLQSEKGFTLGYKTFFQQFIAPAYSTSEFRWNDALLHVKNRERIIAFTRYQQVWISSPEIQELFIKDPTSLHAECRRRIVFFIQYLYKDAGNGFRETMKEITRCADLCLKNVTLKTTA